MEKYSNWTDKATGVKPFVDKSTKIPIWKKSLFYVLGFIKLFFFVSILFANYIQQLLFSKIPVISRPLSKVFNFIQGYLLLALCGIYHVHASSVPLIQKVMFDDKWEKPKDGDVIFAPLCSFIDLIWLVFKFSPIFVIPINQDSCVVKTFHKIMLEILTGKDIRKGKNVKIADVIKEAHDKKEGPVVIFPEAAPTNGAGLLKFVDINTEIIETADPHIFVFQHEFKGVCPNYVCGNSFLYLLQVLGRGYEKMTVKIALAKDTPILNGKIEPESTEKIRDIISKISRIPKVEFVADDYHEYLKEFTSKGKQKNN